MAPLRNALLAAFALASFTSAMPMAIDARSVAVNTVTETAWVTVDVTKTVYVDDEPTPEPKADEVAASAATTTSAPVASSAAEAPKVEQPKVPAAFAEQPQSQSQAPPSPATTSAASAVDASTPASSSPAIQPKTSGAPTGGACEGEGSGCTGDVTHWDGGLGACGWNVDTASDLSIALPVGLMGSLSNSNPYCGRSVSIKSPESGEVIQATVGDKCMGCTGNSIDLTNALFAKVVPNGDGRVSNVEWWFS